MTAYLAFGLGYQELLIVLGIVVLLFGSTKLPKLARSFGSSITEFKKGLKDSPSSTNQIEGGGDGSPPDAAGSSQSKSDG